MKTYNVCAVTSTRADYGLLRSLLLKLECEKQITLSVIVTGTHLLKNFGYTKKEILADNYKNIIDIKILAEQDDKVGMALATSECMKKFADYFASNTPDLLIVLGDRFEIFGAVSVAHMMGVKIAHISGGDVTEGAIDDALRHSMTKMSMIHFPGCEQSAKRIIQMGEEPERVFNVGEPGVENCLNMTLYNRETLAENLAFKNILSDYAVVTFHPVTREEDTAEFQVRELIRAMDNFLNMSYVITLANVDAGGRLINDIWLEEVKKHKNWFVTPSLGMLRYLSAMKYAKLVIGNSSSGIVEAPAIGTPTVNIGDRQKGRMMADSVICCEPVFEKIVSAINKGLSKEMQDVAKHIKSPFGDGTTSSKILNVIINYLQKDNVSSKKKFYDINFKI
mgnify:FL=1